LTISFDDDFRRGNLLCRCVQLLTRT
jgi:hypothetical protein